MAFGQSDGSIILSTKVDTSGIKSGMGSIQGMVGKIGVALAAAFSVKKVYDFMKAVTDAYSEFEQLEGGVKKIFDQANMSQIMEDAQNAFFDLGLSVNAYLRKINDVGATFSAVMGDQKGYDTARKGLLAISDYASGTGKSVDALSEKFTMITRSTSSYQSIADQFSGILPATSKDFLKQAQAAGILSDQYTELTQVPIAEYQAAVTEMLSKGVEDLGLTGNTAAEAASTISGSAAMMEAAWENTLVAISSGEGIDRAVNNLVYSIQKYFENIVPVVERSLIGIGQLVERIAPLLVQTVAQSLIDAMPYLVSAVYQMIIGIATGIYQGIIDLFTGTVNETLEIQAESISASVDNQNALTEAVEDTNKELKKSLAGFDDLQILSSGASDAADSSVGGGTGGAAVSTPSVSPVVNSETTSMITDELAALMLLVGVALVAIGLILLFTGNTSWGVGFIIAGASSVGASAAQMGSMGELSKAIENVFSEYGAMIAGLGAALIVLGIILCATGTALPLGIGLISLGAMAITGAVYANWDSIVKTVKNIFTEFGGIIAGLGAVMIIIGIILCCTGTALPVGIGLIVAGAGFVTGAVVANWDAIVETVEYVFTEFGGIIAGAGAAMIIIGIILCCTGVALPLGIGLIVAGAGFVVGTVVANWDSIVETVEYVFTEFGGIIAAAGVALIVIGIILCCTGVGIGLGIGLILAGAAALTTAVVVNWDSIVGWVKSAWDAVKRFWNRYIAQIFTAAWWLNLGKVCINGLIAGFEGGINGIIWLFEQMINFVVSGLNAFIRGIDSVISAVGNVFGQDWSVATINEVSLGRVSIPRLAKGAVIPANREFLAVLGDQRHGVNIETPLETMIEAFQTALDSRGGTGTTEVILEVDGREFGRAVVEQGNKESRRVGTRLVIV